MTIIDRRSRHSVTLHYISSPVVCGRKSTAAPRPSLKLYIILASDIDSKYQTNKTVSEAASYKKNFKIFRHGFCYLRV